MPVRSAGILMYRRRAGRPLEVLLAHFGGPFWRTKDAGAWGIPKGVVEPGEDPAATARREFEEEIGTSPPGELVPLPEIRQRGGKLVQAFALEGTLDPATVVSNEFTAEWPPRSGRFERFPEVDRAGWFPITIAREKILASQRPLLDALEDRLG